MIRRYFEEEMRYLHEAGKEFAVLHPDQARYLNIESLTDRDPYVERLFEGFAFLTGRIRERLDDEMPQYTEGLFRLLHPHFLRPVPALAILAFQPRPGMLQQTTVLERGLEVRSGPVGEEATACRFTTVYPVHLQPLRLRELRLEWPDRATSSVTLRFELDRGVEYRKLQLDRLRLFFYADPVVASMMRLFFTHHVARLDFRAGGHTVSLSGQQWIQPVGFADDEGLLPYSRFSFAGYRLLQEYFSFPAKFWFVDVGGFDRFEPPSGETTFEVQVHFDRAYPEDRAFKLENIRLYCTPIVNLFEDGAEPIRVEHRLSEYRVMADVHRPKSMQVYDVMRVSGLEEATGKRHDYQPFFSFRHAKDRERFFVESSRIGPSGRRDTYIAAGGFGTDVAALPIETLSLDVRCTNGSLPHEALQEGGITRPAPGYTNVASFSNLTRPTRELLPPIASHPFFLWKLLAHLSLNRTSVATLEALISLLELYDWTDEAVHRRRLAGLRAVSWEPKEIFHRGGIIRGAAVTLEVQDSHFAHEGDLHLFGSVLSAFFSMYATINAFVHLNVISKPSDRLYIWQPQKGAQPLA